VTDDTLNVFINCPFDEPFKPLFEAIVFTVLACGYKVECALAENDSGEIRYDKLCGMIQKSGKSIHDLSRVDLSAAGRPRFNMPFELGLFMGAKRFGGRTQKRKSAIVLNTSPNSLSVYLSDFGGNDPHAHHDRVSDVIRVVRDYLRTRPDGSTVPGQKRLGEKLGEFKAALPMLAERLEIAADEIDPFRDYRDYVVLLERYLAET
jgi:hypothetical protein